MARLALIAAGGAAFGVISAATPIGVALTLAAVAVGVALATGGWRGLIALAVGLARATAGGAEPVAVPPGEEIVVSGVVWESSCDGPGEDTLCRLVLADVRGLTVERLVVDGVFSPAPAAGDVVRLVVAVCPARDAPRPGARPAQTLLARAVTRPEPAP
ncbi:MAG: hypothetical protein KC635_11625, partial [Myxococcales bacterium]|nr:hypothetical protein [Myxococcales bacterium]